MIELLIDIGYLYIGSLLIAAILSTPLMLLYLTMIKIREYKQNKKDWRVE